MMRRGLSLGGLAVVALAVLGARHTGAERSGVAPWDVPDAPNPFPGAPRNAPLLSDPPRLVRASGSKVRLGDGATVELVSVGRRVDDPARERLPDERPLWTPDGAPLHTGRLFGTSDLWPRPAVALEGKGARHLAFRVAPAPGARAFQDATVTGYVPDGARRNTPRPELHGWDVPTRFDIPRDFPGVYTTTVAVDDRSARRYRFAIARGEWKTVTTAAIDATAMTDAVLARGPWGTLRRVAPPKEDPGRFVSAARGLPGPSFVVDEPSSPPSDAYRIRLLDAEGRPNAVAGTMARLKPRNGLPPPAVRVEVSIRPYEWVEFSDVHYDPDPAKWTKGYWGQEGEGAISRSGGTSLQALIRPVPNEYNGWDVGEVYAPDGKVWRAHPNRRAIWPSFSGGTYPEGALVAAFTLEASRVADDRPARIEAFGSTSPSPGEGLGPSLALTAWSTRPLSQMLVPRPATPYVQFAVRYGTDAWAKVREIARRKVELPTVAAKDKAAYDAGARVDVVYSLSLRNDGHAVVDHHRRDGGFVSTSTAMKWPMDDDTRVVARLRSGGRLPLVRSSPGIRGPGTSSLWLPFDLTSDSDGVYDGPLRGGLVKRKVRLSEIAAFEIETQRPADPIYLVARLP